MDNSCKINGEFYFVSGLVSSDLRELFREVKKELKKRGMLKYNTETLIPELTNNVNYANENFEKDSLRFVLPQKDEYFKINFVTTADKRPKNSILFDMLKEDWSYLFDGYDDVEKKYYVYYHTHPNTDNIRLSKDHYYLEFVGVPFYIGKGTGERYLQFSKRNRNHIDKLNKLEKRGLVRKDFCNILVDNLTEKEALELESKLITFFGCKNERINNRRYFINIPGGLLVNTDYGKRPPHIDNLINDIDLNINNY